MPITRAEPAIGRWARSLLAALALVLVTGCSGDDDTSSTKRDPGRDRPGTSGDLSRVPADLGAGRDVARGLTTLLERRAAAVRTGDAAAFEAGLAADPELLAEQGRWFDGVTQLPLSTFDYTLDPASLVRDGRAYWGTVEVGLRLEEYDASPVVTRDRFRFEKAEGRFVVSSVTDRAWERGNPTAAQPWDLGTVEVREGNGVLGIFDAGSADVAEEVVTAVENGVAAVAPRIPLSWDRRVVVYALAEPTFLASLSGVPGGDPLAIDGLTFPVMAKPGSARIAATRFVLNPRLLAADPASRDRLIRHELVHVALGSRDDRIPIWLSEGLAEYLSVRTLPPSERVISGEALAAARAGLTALPDTATFNEADSLANYGVSWWVCEAIAETYGEQMLWTLVEELDGVGDPDADLELLLGVSSQQLVRDAGELMLATYEGEPEPTRRRNAS